MEFKKIKNKTILIFWCGINSRFTGIGELDEVYGARFILLDDINTFKNYQNHQVTCRSNYSLVTKNFPSVMDMPFLETE